MSEQKSSRPLWQYIVGLGVVVIVMAVIAEATEDAGSSIAVVAVAAVAYFLPWIVAAKRKVPNLGSVVIVNIFLGWTLVGWVVAMAMAMRTAPEVMPVEPTRTCPWCAETVKAAAVVCRHCGRELTQNAEKPPSP